ncbi:MAG TPA: TOBE domain-containing protein [Steroidobacteraceae bacterium]|nr:TOBE domain-containing protein [Steroidobacteraceae bacterium]
MADPSTKKNPAPRPKPGALELAGSLELSRRGHKYLGGNRIRLLEAIDRLGSITQAAKDVNLSYKAAWDAVDAMNNVAEQPLLIRAPGGQHGGGSRLTEHGHQIVRLYRLLESGYLRLLTQMQAQMHDFDRLSELLRSISVKTSARNQYRGTVQSVQKGAVNADVVLDIGDGQTIFANITNDAVEDLQLKRGREATALIKSSLVLLSPDAHVRISARNRLTGTVAQIRRGAVNSEVILQLAGSRRLTAIVTNEAVAELQLAVGAPCCALVKASHVILAVSD